MSKRAEPRLVRRARPLMGTLVSVSAYVRSSAHLAIDEAFTEMRRLEAIFSEFQPSSAVSRLNAAAGRAGVRLPDEVLQVLETAQCVARASAGAFDVTWAALREVWLLEPELFSQPRKAHLQAALTRVGFERLRLSLPRKTARLELPGMRVGLGGIAKAFIAQRGAEFLQTRGVEHLLINAGGDVVARGLNGEVPWAVGLQHPRLPGMAWALVEVHNAALVTSGDYERFVEVKGVRRHHLLDPRTGWPARKCQSVSVLAQEGTVAEALSTAIFVGGPKSARLIDAFNARAVFIVDGRGRQTVHERAISGS